MAPLLLIGIYSLIGLLLCVAKNFLALRAKKQQKHFLPLRAKLNTWQFFPASRIINSVSNLALDFCACFYSYQLNSFNSNNSNSPPQTLKFKVMSLFFKISSWFFKGTFYYINELISQPIFHFCTLLLGACKLKTLCLGGSFTPKATRRIVRKWNLYLLLISLMSK